MGNCNCINNLKRLIKDKYSDINEDIHSNDISIEFKTQKIIPDGFSYRNEKYSNFEVKIPCTQRNGKQIIKKEIGKAQWNFCAFCGEKYESKSDEINIIFENS